MIAAGGQQEFRCTRISTNIVPRSTSEAAALIQVSDVLPRASEERLVKPDLVDVVADETGRPAEDEDGVQDAAPDVAVGFIPEKQVTVKALLNAFRKKLGIID